MLKLKFCIPPQIAVAGGISAELDLDFEFDATLQAEVQSNIETAFGVQPTDKFVPPIPLIPRIPPPPLEPTSELSQALVLGWTDLTDSNISQPAYSPIPLSNLAFDAQEAGKAATGILSVSAGLEWEQEVKFP